MTEAPAVKRDRWNKWRDPKDYRFTAIGKHILRLLDPWDAYDMLPTNWIPPFIEAHPKYVESRLPILWDAFNFLERRTLSGKSNNATFNYSLSDLGMRQYGLTRPYHRSNEWDKHALTSALVRAQLDLGVRTNPDQRLAHARAILSHPKCTATGKHPFRFKFGDTEVVPDDKPMVINRKSDNASFLFIREDDRNNEQQSTTIKRKFENYRTIWERKLYRDKYGIDRAFLLFVCLTKGRQMELMKTAASVFPERRCSFILFAHVPELFDLYRTIPLTTQLYTQPWKRVGGPDFSLVTLSDVAA